MDKLILPLVVLILFTFNSARAQLKIINPNDQAVSLAIGFYNETGLLKSWSTQGWVNIAPHDSVTFIPKGIAGGEFYYYGRIVGCDQTYQGQYGLHIHPQEAFTIANAASDAPLSLSKGLEKVAFTKVSVPNGKRDYRLILPTANCTQQGVRQGSWTVLLDRDKEETINEGDATYARKITYQNGVPTGLIRDYFIGTNVLQWDGKLKSEHPDVREGTCVTYNTSGQKIEEAVYQDGESVGQVRRWGNDGKEIFTKKTYKTVTVLQPQVGYLVSYYNTGNSRTVIPVTLPENTVEWYYEFTAYRDKAEIQLAQEKFKLASELTYLIDQTGTLKLATDLLTTPPGGDICNVYLFDSKKKSDLFMQKLKPDPVWEGSRESLTSAVVPVQTRNRQVYLGLHNPASMDGIHFAIEVVAVVEIDESAVTVKN